MNRAALALAFLLTARAGADEAKEPEPGESKDDSINAAESDDAEPERERSTWNAYDSRLFSIRVGGDVLLDFARYLQDDASEQQMNLPAGNGLRDLRLVASGQLKFVKGLSYSLGYMYDGAEAIWRLRQTGLMLDIPALNGNLFVGRTKEGFSTIKIMVGFNGWTIERAAASDAFIPILADGVKWIGRGFGHKLVYNLGVFPENLTPKQPYEKNLLIVSGRAVFLPLPEDGKDLLHLAFEARYGSSVDNNLQYKSKPESFLAASQAVDTGKFPATGAATFGVEAYFQHAQWLLGSEWYFNKVFSKQTGNPFFHGGEIFASWILTGETKPYNEKDAFFEGVVPKKPVFSGGPGAWELVLRWSDVDLDSGTIRGGRFWRITPAVSWYLSDNFRIILEYGFSRLDRNGLEGNTHYLQTRLQLTFM